MPATVVAATLGRSPITCFAVRIPGDVLSDAVPGTSPESAGKNRTIPKHTVVALICLLALASGAFAAESFDTRLAKAHASLRNGDPDSALTMYRELQTEDPESDILYYSMGCAQCKQGELLQETAPRDAVEGFKVARQSFEKVLNARDPEIRKKAQYNHATATARIAQSAINAQQYEETKKAFEESVAEYEAYLKQYRKDSSARCNLFHMRYLLKKLLQNPPPPQEQQQGQDGKQQEQNQQGQNQQQCQNPKQGESEQKAGEEKKDDRGGKEDQEKKQDQEQGEAQAMAANKDQQDQKDKQKESVDKPEPDSQRNVEAILQSLEDVDKREQKETKNVRTEVKIGRDWW